MKFYSCLVVFFVFIGGFLNTTVSNTIEQQKAEYFLNTRGEVYFTFGISSREQISVLTDIISIDKVQGFDIFAYANSETFAKFKECNLNYEVLTPPSLTGPTPTMSDYSDPDQEWNKYPTYEGYLEILDSFQKKYPDKVKIHEIGTSIKNRKIMVAQVSNNVGKRENEPKFFHTSTIHGDEVTGYVLLLHMMDYLLTNYRKDARVTKLIDSAEIWFAPLINPDGTYARGNNSVQGATRGNSKGVDMNRDYQYPGSTKKPQPESQVLIDFQAKHRFVLSIDFHGGVECFLTPWGYKKSYPQDKEWFSTVCRDYVDDVHEVNSGTFKGKSGCGSIELYIAKGIRPDHQLFKNQCRSVTVELSSRKTVAESKLLDYWKWHKDAVLNYYMEMFYGIRGTVTAVSDNNNSIGVPAKVSVKSTTGNWKDDAYSHVFADTLHGNFYRPLHPGTFDVTFSHPGYDDVVVKNVQVKKGQGTHLAVKMGDTTNVLHKLKNLNSFFTLTPHKNGLTILLPPNTISIEIFNTNGSLMRRFENNLNTGTNKSIVWDGTSHKGKTLGNGCYIVTVITSDFQYTKHFVFTR